MTSLVLINATTWRCSFTRLLQLLASLDYTPPDISDLVGLVYSDYKDVTCKDIVSLRIPVISLTKGVSLFEAPLGSRSG